MTTPAQDPKLRSLTAGRDLVYHPIVATREAREYLRQVSRSLLLTGVFVHDSDPPPPGTVLSLELRRPGRPAQKAIGVVSWRSLLPECQGMALDLAATEVTESRPLADWLAHHLTEETISTATGLARLGEWIGRAFASPVRLVH